MAITANDFIKIGEYQSKFEERSDLIKLCRRVLTEINQDNFLTVGDTQDLEAKKLLRILNEYLGIK